MHIIKIVYIASFIIFVGLVFSVDMITKYLDKKPKTNRLRKFWSRHIIDLDGLYNE